MRGPATYCVGTGVEGSSLFFNVEDKMLTKHTNPMRHMPTTRTAYYIYLFIYTYVQNCSTRLMEGGGLGARTNRVPSGFEHFLTQNTHCNQTVCYVVNQPFLSFEKTITPTGIPSCPPPFRTQRRRDVRV
jgi:hypothetical protein